MQATLSEFISVPEAAEILGCTEGRVRQLLYEDVIDGRKLNGRAWIISRASVERYGRKEITVGRPRVSAET